MLGTYYENQEMSPVLTSDGKALLQMNFWDFKDST